MEGFASPFDSKSSTIHSAFCSQSAAEEVRSCETVCPVDVFSITAVPAVVDVAVTVTVTTSPAEKEMPEKSYA